MRRRNSSRGAAENAEKKEEETGFTGFTGRSRKEQMPMAWSDDPKIRDLEPYCKKHGYAFVVVMAVHEEANAYDTNTYGRSQNLCRVAAIAGEQLIKLVEDGTWPDWPDDLDAAMLAAGAFARREALTVMVEKLTPRVVELEGAMEAYRKAFYHILDNFNKLVTAAKCSDFEEMDGKSIQQWADEVRQAVSDCIEGRSV